MKIFFRTIYGIPFFIISYPFLVLAFSGLGVFTVAGIMGMIVGLIGLPIGTKEMLKDSFYLTFMPFCIPFAFLYEWIAYGKTEWIKGR